MAARWKLPPQRSLSNDELPQESESTGHAMLVWNDLRKLIIALATLHISIIKKHYYDHMTIIVFRGKRLVRLAPDDYIQTEVQHGTETILFYIRVSWRRPSG